VFYLAVENAKAAVICRLKMQLVVINSHLTVAILHRDSLLSDSLEASSSKSAKSIAKHRAEDGSDQQSVKRQGGHGAEDGSDQQSVQRQGGHGAEDGQAGGQQRHQQGEGNPEGPQHQSSRYFPDKEALETIAKLVAEKIYPQPVTSSWPFYERAEPTNVSTQGVLVPPQNVYGVSVRKSDLNDNFDIGKALKKIPKQERAKASNLLKEIELRSPELTFDSKGTIYIDGENIPNSNFFLFFPLLFKTRVPKVSPGFPDFVAKLNSMGLQHLFVLKREFKEKVKLENQLNKEIEEKAEGAPKEWWKLN